MHCRFLNARAIELRNRIRRTSQQCRSTSLKVRLPYWITLLSVFGLSSTLAGQSSNSPGDLNINPDYSLPREAYNVSSALRDNWSLSEEKLRVRFGGHSLVIPRNYLVSSNLSETEATDPFILMQVAFPDMKPLTAENETCLLAAPSRRPIGCYPVRFHLEPKAKPNQEIVEHLLKADTRLIKIGQTDLLYFHLGPDRSIYPGLDIYFSKTMRNWFLAECVVFDNSNEAKGSCSSEFEVDGVGVKFLFDEVHVSDSETIYHSLAEVITSFMKDSRDER